MHDMTELLWCVLYPCAAAPAAVAAISPRITTRLVKRVVDVGRPLRDEKLSHQVQLEVMLGVLQQQGASTSMDELECMLTVAISSKYIKGYISNKQKVLVLSRTDAFPEPTSEWWTPITAENAVP